GRARHRRSTGRWRLVEARRAVRHRRPGRPHGPCPRPRSVAGPGPLADARPRPIVLVVLDGFGIGRDPSGDAIAAAPMPTWRGLLGGRPPSVLKARRADAPPSSGT